MTHTEMLAETLTEGQPAPAFHTPNQDGDVVTLDSLKGAPFVLYFYPKDDTPGCTKEACAFRDALPDFSAADVKIFGVSKDSQAKHQKFIAKYDLTFPLLADEDGNLCEAYGVWVEKSMYGKKYMGIERATFLIGADGLIKKIWRKVKVPGHAEAVYQAVRAL